MRTVAARHLLPGADVAVAEALWLDLNRWPAFVDGFASVGRLRGDWPLARFAVELQADRELAS